jgi:hypothetical protein
MQSGAPAVLATGAGSAIALDRHTILCAGAGRKLYTVDVATGEATPWILSWSPEEDGWLTDGGIYEMEVSPDGRWVCLALSVNLPDRCEFPPGMEGMRSPIVGILAESDGSGARPVFMGVAVGGGPDYAFTTDSRFLAGSPMFACEPTPEDYSLFAASYWDDPAAGFCNAVETATGDRRTLDTAGIGDGFWKCPYSDNFRIENNWYEVHDFGSFQEPGILGHWETPPGCSSRFYGWVLPDAVLIASDDTRLLLSVDGTTREVGIPPDLVIEAWLPDGSYLYSMEGRPDTIRHARIDWESSVIEDLGSFDLPPELSGLMMVPMPGSEGVFILGRRDTGNLYYFEIP